MKVFTLNANFLSGSISPEISNLLKLTRLYLATNKLEGPIPAGIWKLTKLDSLQLHENSLDGSISPKIGQLVNLEDLRLHENKLMGPIPPEVWKLTKLESYSFMKIH